jgi:hypothetical protein
MNTQPVTATGPVVLTQGLMPSGKSGAPGCASLDASSW